MSIKSGLVSMLFDKGLNRLLVLLVVVTLAIMGLRGLTFPSQLAGGDRLWLLTIDVSFEGVENQSLVNVNIPYTTPYVQLVQQNIAHPGLRISHSRGGDNPRRGVSAIARRDGPLSLAVEFTLQQSSAPSLPVVSLPLSSKSRELYLKDESWLNLEQPELQGLARRLAQAAQDEQQLLLKIYQYCHGLKALPNTSKAQPDTSVPLSRVIASQKASARQRALLFVALARAVQVPARMVTGFVLRESLDLQPHFWVQAYSDDAWMSFDPFHGYQRDLPENFVPFVYNSEAIAQVIRGDRLSVEYALEEDFSAVLKMNQRYWYSVFDLSRLNLETRNTLATLLLLPLGVLITAIFRHFIGVHSYGVFTPTLLALAVIYNSWQTSLTILAVMISFAVLGRRAFPRKLSRTPRLAIIFTLVALSMAIGVSLIDYYMPSPDGYAVLLPIVILTSLVDRFYNTLDDKGVSIASIRLFWTIIITIACLPLVHFKPLGHLLVRYPELHLLTLACILYITHYRGKTLSRFVPAILKEPAANASDDVRPVRSDDA